jgi:hypothetical protein
MKFMIPILLAVFLVIIFIAFCVILSTFRMCKF